MTNEIKRPIVTCESKLEYVRYTLRAVLLIAILAILSLFFALFQYSKAKTQLKENETEIQSLKERLSKYEAQVYLEKLNKERLVIAVQSIIEPISKRHGVTPETARHLAELEVEASSQYNFLLSVGLAISLQESGWNPVAISDNGSSHGIKQINLYAWRPRFKDLTIPKLREPEVNIPLGYKIVSEHLQKTGSLATALKRYRGSEIPEENEQYAQDVIKAAKAIEKNLSAQQT